MRLLFCSLLLAPLFSCWSHAEELIPGVIAFDPPGFLSTLSATGFSTNLDAGVQVIRRYAATDNDPRASQRLVIVSLRELGTNPMTAQTTGVAPSDNKALVGIMQSVINSTPNAVNIATATNAEVGARPAWLVTYQIPRPYWQKAEGELFPYEVYWVKVKTNQVAEIKLIADSMEHLQTLKSCLPRFKITPPNPANVTGTADLAR